MTNETESTPTTKKSWKSERTVVHHHHRSGGGDAVYGLGMIGAAIYFIQQAESFWPGVVGFLKALVWPVFMVYELFKNVYLG